MRIALIVPAYQPEDALIALLRRYMHTMNCVPVVVNDGSGADYDALFERLPRGCVCLSHAKNRGKGAALKTGMRYALDHLPDCDVVATADADGQFRGEDVLRVCEAALACPGALVLGCRTFEGGAPFASRFANGFTRRAFSLATGIPLKDALTGLRAFDRAMLRYFLNVSGARYEYEINMLLHAAQDGVTIRQEPVTVRLAGKSADVHFNPLRDTFKITVRILTYVGTSLFAFGIDFAILLILKRLTASWGETPSLLFSVVLARIASASVKFFCDRHLVFRSKGNWRSEISKHAGATFFILAANYLLMHLLTIVLDLPLIPSKLLVEMTLFFVNFRLQGRFVYKRGKGM